MQILILLGYFAALYVILFGFRLLGTSGVSIFLGKFAGFIAISMVGVTSGTIPFAVGLVLAMLPVIMLFARQLYFYAVGRAALAGKLGEERQWVAELVMDEDKEFLLAQRHLSDMDKKEIYIMADNKQELRELTIERAEESTDS